jgi:two-component system nitrogen regulation response regulator NtrX
MSLQTQAKILRVLQEQKIQRVGGSRTISVDVRIIAASNKNLEEEIEKGRFREDLFYRLNVLPINVPALRQRADDIPLLVETFLEDFAIQNRDRRKKITSDALEILGKYTWPGNVRELKNLVERLAILVDDDAIDSHDIPDAYILESNWVNDLTEYQFLNSETLKEARSVFEQTFITRKLMQHRDNVTKTAEAIGVGRSFLHKKIKSFKGRKLS